MAESTAVVEASAAAPTPGTDTPAGTSPSTPATSENQPAAPAATPEQAPSTPAAKKYRFKSQDEAERAHSELQSRYSRLGDPEQAAQSLGLLTSLRNDPEFQAWAQARLAKQQTGSDDPETVKALQIVESVAERKAQQLIAPYAQQAARAQAASVVQEMTAKHPDWQQHLQPMGEAFQAGVKAGFFSPTATPILNLTLLEGLYKWVTGGDEAFAAKAYQKALAQKHATSTQSTPGLAPGAAAPAPVKGFANLMRQTLREQGLG